MPTWPTERASTGQGFTLLELLIALSLGAVVVVTLHQVFANAQRTDSRVRQTLEFRQSQRFFIDRLRKDLKSLFLNARPFSGKEDGFNSSYRDEKNRITVLTYRVTQEREGYRVLRTEAEGEASVTLETSEIPLFAFLEGGQWRQEINKPPKAVRVVVGDTENGGWQIVVALEMEAEPVAEEKFGLLKQSLPERADKEN